jgi:heat shock protein HslJ
MACERAIMEQERRFLSILAAARSYSRYGNGSLSIIAPDGRAIRFRPGT